MASTLCPNCGRKLSPLNPKARMTCDGCSHAFDPARVHWRKASIPRRLLGWSLILVAAASAIRAIPNALRPPFKDESAPFYIVGLYLFPAVLFFAGLALKRSRLVEDPATAAKADQAPRGLD